MNDQEIKRQRIFLLIAGLMLCLAVLPIWPYGYYMLLRLVVCGAAGYVAYQIKDQEKLSKHFIPLIILAFLFNPLIPVYLSRTLWLPVDLLTALYFLTLSKKIAE